LKKVSLDRNVLKNYRPVSNIAAISKYVEKVVTARLCEHINRHDLFEPLQSAYRSQHSTETALLAVQDDFLRVIDQQKNVFLVMLELSVGTALKWFSSYFQSRTNHVTIHGANSDSIDLDDGVLQGTVIGTISLAMYTVPIGDILRHHGMLYHMYADDVQIYLLFDPNLPMEAECALFKLTACVRDIQNRMFSNKLKLNNENTEFLVVAFSNNL
jgi:hypothetical protein